MANLPEYEQHKYTLISRFVKNKSEGVIVMPKMDDPVFASGIIIVCISHNADYVFLCWHTLLVTSAGRGQER